MESALRESGTERRRSSVTDGKLHDGDEEGGETEGRRTAERGIKRATGKRKSEKREGGMPRDQGESFLRNARACTHVPRVRSDDVGVCRSK